MIFESATIDVVAVVDGEFASTLGDSKSGRPILLKLVQPQLRGSDFSLAHLIKGTSIFCLVLSSH